MSKSYEKVAGVFDTLEVAEKFCDRVENNYPSKEDVYDINLLTFIKNKRTVTKSFNNGQVLVVMTAKEDFITEISALVINGGGRNVDTAQLRSLGIKNR